MNILKHFACFVFGRVRICQTKTALDFFCKASGGLITNKQKANKNLTKGVAIQIERHIVFYIFEASKCDVLYTNCCAKILHHPYIYTHSADFSDKSVVYLSD